MKCLNGQQIFERVEVDANHWAVLSQPQEIAQYIETFALKNSES